MGDDKYRIVRVTRANGNEHYEVQERFPVGSSFYWDTAIDGLTPRHHRRLPPAQRQLRRLLKRDARWDGFKRVKTEVVG